MTIRTTSATPPVPTARQAADHAAQEYAALLTMLRSLSAPDWDRPTECPGWTVRDMVAHLTGAAEEAVRPVVQARHLAIALTRDRTLAVADSLSAQQIAARSGHGSARIMADLDRLAARAPRKRAGVPAVIRRAGLPAGVGAPQPGDTLAYLLDVIATRDVWMHRIDIDRATGCGMTRSDAEPAIVAQIVRDLSRTWQAPGFTLVLTGRAPGRWTIGGDAEPDGTLTVDTVALCRLLAGRSDETEPAYEGRHPGLPGQLRAARILF